MARIVGVDLPNKAVKIALTYIYGIGKKSAMDICQKTNINPDVRINTLSSEEIASLYTLCKNISNCKRKYIDHDDRYYCIEGCIPEGMEEGRILENADVVLDSY